MNKEIKPGVPYIEIMPDGSKWEFIDLGKPEFCILGLSDEQLKEIQKIERLEKDK